MVAVLTFLYCLSFLNRQMPLLMVDPLREGLALSEIQIGLINGFAFAAFYALFGLPFGWLSDHWPRRFVILLGTLIWCAAGIVCGLADSFEELLIGRFLLGIGAAALAPAAFSMIADSFPAERLALPSSVFSSGATIGSGLALAVGGLLIAAMPQVGIQLPLIGKLAGWQLAFLAAVAPCLLFWWLIFTIPEPPRQKPPHPVTAQAARPGLFTLIRPHKRFYLCHFAAFSLLPAGLIAVTAWMPTLLMRRYGLSPGEAGPAVALMVGVGCTLGSMTVGAITDRLFARGVADAHLRVYVPILALQLVTLALAVSTQNLYFCLAMTALYYTTLSFSGVAVSALGIVTPPAFRGRIIGAFVMTYTLVGSGLGPLLTASVTSYVFADDAMVGWSMLVVNAIVLPLVAALLIAALRPLRTAVAACG